MREFVYLLSFIVLVIAILYQVDFKTAKPPKATPLKHLESDKSRLREIGKLDKDIVGSSSERYLKHLE